MKDLRERAMVDVREKADRDFSDTRYNWLRTQPRRRLLVVLTYLLVLSYGTTNYFDLPFATLPALLLFMGCIWLLRVSVRGVTDYPDEVVDERMREMRGYTYRYAFMGVMVIMSGYLVIYIANQLLAKPGYVLPMTADQLHDLAFVTFFACMALPSAIYAWNEPGEPEAL